MYELSVLLKRVALAAYPRQEVASLHGSEWVDFLSRTCPGADLSGLVVADTTAPAGPEVKQAAGQWIRHHRRPGTGMEMERERATA